MELIAAREQRLRDRGKDPRPPKAAKRTGVKKAAKKKVTRKKPARKTARRQAVAGKS